MYLGGCGCTPLRDDGKSDAELSMDAEPAWECDYKPHGERHADQHFILCGSSQNCQNHQSLGISTTVLSLVKCNRKE